MTAEEIIQDQKGTIKSKLEVLTQFIDNLAQTEPKVLDKLNIFLVDLQKKKLHTVIVVSDELKLFIKNIVKTSDQATISDAQEVLQQTSPEQLGKLIEKLLLEQSGVKSLSELDLDAVYDDLSKELDSYEEEFGENELLTELFKL